MPNNGSLDSIILEIGGTSEKANESISNIIGSLRHFAKSIGTVVPALRSLNTELKTLARYGKIKLPSVGESLSKTTKSIKKATNYYDPLTNNNRIAVNKPSNPAADATWQQQYNANVQKSFQEHAYRRYMNNFYRERQRLISLGLFKDDSKSTTETPEQTGEAIKKIGEEAEKAKGKTNGLFSSIARIAKTMLIRTAIRSLIKAFGESWQAAYQFSSKMNGSFAKSIDAIKATFSDTATTIIQTFAPVLQALAPVIYVIGNAIQYLCSGIQQLLQLLGISSDLFGKNTKDINKYIGSSNNASKSNKNLLASWDQLNIIQSKNSGGSGSGSGYKPGSLKNIVSKETNAILSVIAGEAMLGVGLILACTGHIGAGTALMAVGAASIAKVMVNDWSTLPNNVKKTVAEITTIAGASFLALGLILAFTGHVGVGIGLIALGAVNLAASVAVAWGEEVTSGVRKAVTDILVIAGTSMLALGLIFALSGVGVGLGIGMMISGGVALGTAVALNWDFVKEKVTKIMTDIGDWFVEKWNAISEAVSSAWNAVAKWWEENVSTTISTAWQGVSDFFSKLFGDANTDGSIAKFATTAWGAVSSWWTTNVSENVQKEGVWGGIKGFFKGIFVGADGTGGILGFSKTAFDEVCEWTKEKTGIDIKAAFEGIGEFFRTLFGSTEVPGSIADFANNAWVSISTWWTEDVVGFITRAWTGITSFFSGLWFGDDGQGGIAGFFETAWESISNLWGDIVGSVENAWKSVATWFHNNVTMPIGNFFIDCINGIIDGINWMIERLNTVNIKIPSVSLPLIGKLWDETVIGIHGIGLLEKLGKIQAITENANGAYGIPRGDLFIANEAGAELVGSMNGKTTVANQGQIIEGISNGVRDANAEQNALLRQQNELLRNILNSSGSITVEPSAAWGKFNQRSAEMWSMATGR